MNWISFEKRPALEWPRMLLWGPLVVGGVVAALWSARPAKLRRAIKRLLAESPADDRARELLREAIVGNDKHAIVTAFGPPRTATHRGRSGTRATPEQYMAASTWYYPFDHAEQTAVVIQFEGGVAQDALFIRAPKRVA